MLYLLSGWDLSIQILEVIQFSLLVARLSTCFNLIIKQLEVSACDIDGVTY